MKTFIYSLCDPITDEIRYIGKTDQYLKQRLYSHIQECKSNKKSHKISWIKSLLFQDLRPFIKVIDEVPQEEWKYWECYYIELYRSKGCNLTNLTDGGQGGSGYKHTQESRNRMRKSKLGQKLSEEHKEKISKSIIQKSSENPYYNRSGNNMKHDPIDKDLLYKLYIIENLSMVNISKILKCGKKKIWDNIQNYDIKKDKEIWKSQCASQKVKKVIQYNLDGNFIKEWESAVSVYKELKIKPDKCCRGEAKSAGGFIWKYK